MIFNTQYWLVRSFYLRHLTNPLYNQGCSPRKSKDQTLPIGRIGNILHGSSKRPILCLVDWTSRVAINKTSAFFCILKVSRLLSLPKSDAVLLFIFWVMKKLALIFWNSLKPTFEEKHDTTECSAISSKGNYVVVLDERIHFVLDKLVLDWRIAIQIAPLQWYFQTDLFSMSFESCKFEDFEGLDAVDRHQNLRDAPIYH